MDEKLQEAISLLDGVSQTGENQYTARCPAHDDRVNSLSLGLGDNGGIVMHCHAGCEKSAVCHAMGKTLTWLMPDNGLPKGVKYKDRGKLTQTFDYLDEEGVLLFQTCRYQHEPTGDGKKPTKEFIQRRPNGKGGWTYGVKGVRKIPYRLPELVKSGSQTPVLIAEGEKHVDKLIEMGFVATCNAGGAGSWTKTHHSPFLNGRDVIILPDNDKAGKKHAAKVRDALDGIAKSVLQVELPNLPESGDIIDWCAAGGTAEELRHLIENATVTVPDFKVETPKIDLNDPALLDPELKIVEKLGIDVFGEDDKGRIKVFSQYHRKTEYIRDIERITFGSLLRLCGPIIRQFVYEGQDDSPDEMFKIKDVKHAISTLAGYRRVSEDSELGLGVWESSPGEDHPSSILMVNSGSVSIYNGSLQLEEQNTPRYGDTIVDISTSEPWFDHATVAGYISNYTQEWADSVMDEVENLFDQWKYTNQGVCPAVLTGLVLASYVQTVWDWRPQIAISGKSDSGKSTMFGVLSGRNDNEGGLFGDLTICSGDVSAAGLKQALTNTAKIVILDEFEDSSHRREIIQLLRNAGRGNLAIRGTTHHKAVDFRLRHMVWTAAIESGLNREADRNRFILIELVRPEDSEMGKMKIPDDKSIRELGQKLLAIAVRNVRQARSLIASLNASRPEGFHNRVIESYSVPASMYATCRGLNGDEAASVLLQMLETHEIDTGEGDEDTLLENILNYKVNLGAGSVSTIGEMITYSLRNDSSHDAMSSDYDALLRSNGVYVIHEAPETGAWCEGAEKCVFFASGAIRRYALKGTDHEYSNVAQVLKRFPNAKACQKMIQGNRSRGVLLPGEVFLVDTASC